MQYQYGKCYSYRLIHFDIIAAKLNAYQLMMYKICSLDTFLYFRYIIKIARESLTTPGDALAVNIQTFLLLHLSL